MPHPSSTVHIVDNDECVRFSLERLMRAARLGCKSYASAEEFVRKGDNGAGPACLVLDVRMDGMSGLELQERLANSSLRYPIIFLTAHGNIPMSVQAMKEGAFDFFTKPVDDDQLLAAISKALETHARILSETDAPFHERLESLTPREFEVMRCVISGALNKQIAAHLGVVEKTVKAHRGHVMHKLGIESVAELVRRSMEAGVDPIAV